jgi:hypothetical protein
MDHSGDRYRFASELAAAFLDAPWRVEPLAEAGAGRLGRWPSWMLALTHRTVAVFPTAPPDPRPLFTLIAGFLDEQVAAGRSLGPAPPDRTPGPRRPVRPVPPPDRAAWQLPSIANPADLAARLELSLGQLEWLADARGLERSVGRERLRNYRYLAVARRHGMPRVIEAPKLRLKEIQRWILREVLDRVPVHPAAHGFVAGRSVISHADVHTGERALLRLDLRDFFASVPAGRVYQTWRTLGYDLAVAHALTGLTTNVVPLSVWQQIVDSTPTDDVQARFWFGRQLATPHLPQGAPTSPALANLAAFRLDRRLAGLAASSGLRYSRYADDLIFSGGSRLIRRRAGFERLVAGIARAEGFRLNEAKSTTQAASGRQTVCGVVVNRRTNVRRSEYDELRAMLHNAARSGPAGQNRDGIENFAAHLLGRISWIEALNPGRGRRLRELYAAIDWT